MSDIDALITAATAGQRQALARLLSIAERGDHYLADIERAVAPLVGNAFIVGITGPPGAGKSTLINQILPHATAEFGAAAVLAVDPSSPFTDGAILGDRVRMLGDNLGNSVFIRSMASRGEAGGLARAASTCVRLFDACHWPVIIIETLGIGQVELEIMNLADSVLVVLNPGWGDSIQANKAGLTEAGDVFTINKADKPGVELTRKDLLESLALLTDRPAPVVVQTISTTGEGVEHLWQTIMSHRERLQTDGNLLNRRIEKRQKVVRKLIADQLGRMLEDTLDTEFGRAVLENTVGGEVDINITVARLLQRMSTPDRSH